MGQQLGAPKPSSSAESSICQHCAAALLLHGNKWAPGHDLVREAQQHQGAHTDAAPGMSTKRAAHGRGCSHSGLECMTTPKATKAS